MDENNYLIKTIIDLLKEIYENGVNKYLNEGLPTVKIIDFSVDYPKSNNVVDYINSGATYEAKIRMKYTTINDGKESKKDPIEIKVPILLDGIYVVEGKTKLPLNHVVNDPQIAIYKNKIIIDSERYISKVNGLKYLDPDTGAFIKYDWDGPKQDNILKLDDYASKKLGIIFHLDENPLELTKEVTDIIQNKITDKLRDNVLNKKIMDAPGALIRCLKVNKAIILHKIRNKYYQSMRYKTESNKAKLYARDIQSVIDKFFKGNDQYFHGIQNPTNVNPLIFQSMKNKVIFENDSTKTSKYIPYAKYDTSFYGIVDPILTPDNTNTSRVNELTRCVSIRDGETWIKCLDKQFNIVELKYIDYVNSKVLLSKYVDYDFNEVEQLAEYDVKYRFETIKSPFYDYMEMSPDWRLSLATAQVPMLNLDDSIRVAMGSQGVLPISGMIYK